MAVLHLEFEIDSEVYPELHAMLSSISGEASRSERLRQLAASGLVWEYVRLRTPAAPHAPAGPMARPAAGAPARAERASAVPAPRAPAATRAPAPAPDFVDLAIDALPPPPPPGPRVAELRSHEPPLLVDVVEQAPDDSGPMPLPEPPPAAAPDEAPSSRTRLLRMRDRGLFRNG